MIRDGGAAFAVPLLAMLTSMLRDREDARDVLQETYLQAWRQRDRFDATRGNEEAWLTTIARSRALDALRRRRARELPMITIAAPPQFERSRVRVALSRLRPQHRQVIELALLDGMSGSEVAAALRLPLGTVKTRMRKAKAALLAELG